MSVKIDAKYLITDEDKKKLKWNLTFDKFNDSYKHQFASICTDGTKVCVLNGQACTGGLPGLSNWKGETQLDNLYFLSKPIASGGSPHKEYLNILLNPETSPYKYLMSPDNYKVHLDDDKNINAWAFFDNSVLMADIGGLAILERIFTQHGNPNPFWDVWKKSDLPFQAFFYLTHSIYQNFNIQRWSMRPPQTPYSAFNMFRAGLSYSVYKNTIPAHQFSAPRFFQGIPNHEIVKKVDTATLKKPWTSRHHANAIWDDYYNTDSCKITIQFEKELKDLISKHLLVYTDSWNENVDAKRSWNHPNEKDWNWRKDQKKCGQYQREIIDKIVGLLHEYTPKFMETKVA